MVKVGVIGAGYLGKFHIEKFLKLDECELVGIVDTSANVRDEIKKKYNVPVFSDYQELSGKVDAVSIVVPTNYHYDVASFFIKNRIHTFIEKPVTENIEQCEKLLSLDRTGLKIQVGHIERFNPVYKFLEKYSENPVSISIRRKAPFTPRGTEVDIVFDLMIHDIDIILSLFKKQDLVVKSYCSAKVITNNNDYFKVDLKIDGVDVSLEASRLHFKKERSVTLVTKYAVFEGDFINQDAYFITKGTEKHLDEGKKDILLEELGCFVEAIVKDRPVKVSLEDGYHAIVAAHRLVSLSGTQK